MNNIFIFAFMLSNQTQQFVHYRNNYVICQRINTHRLCIVEQCYPIVLILSNVIDV